MTARLVEPPWRFRGFPEEGFRVFAVEDRESRRRAIVDAFHPGLRELSEDLLDRIDPERGAGLHAHLPRLDWPRGYQPFCTWLAISRLPHGYQAGPQLNVGVHAGFVAARYAWDTATDAFGRFEFQCRIGGVGDELHEIASRVGLAFRVYASAPWPEGSRVAFESPHDWQGALDEIRRHGNWFEVGKRWDLPASVDLVTGPALGPACHEVLSALYAVFERT